MDMHRSAARPGGRALATVVVAALLLALVPLAGIAQAFEGAIEISTGDGLVPSIRFAGEDRFETAGLIATDDTPFAAQFDGSTVLLARADLFPDALAGSLLGGDQRAPIVLTPSDTADDAGGLNEDTREALDGFPNLDTVYILGGTVAIADDVVEAVEDEFDVDTIRLDGVNRFETAALIAEEVLGDTETDTAIVANGGNFPDALVSGALAAAAGIPILLTGSDGPLDPFTEGILEDKNVEEVFIAGGDQAISQDVEDQISDLGIDTRRVAGADRFETAVEFAELEVSEYGFGTDHFNLATANNFPDSLALGPQAGLDYNGPAPILLTAPDALSSQTEDYFETFDSCTFETLHVAGGIFAVSEEAEDDAREALTAVGDACQITLTPQSDTNVIGETHTVTATVTDNAGDPAEDGTVRFLVNESVTASESSTAVATPESGTAQIDANGQATFSFTSFTPGSVTISATVTSSTGEEVTATATKVFTLPLNATGFRLQGAPGSQTLVRFNVATGVVESSTAITGLMVGRQFVGVDIRPLTGVLYAIDNTGQIYTLTSTASSTAATPQGAPLPGFTFNALTDGVGFDFNPMVDRIRIVNSANQNYRFNPNNNTNVDDPAIPGNRDGDLRFETGSALTGDPNVTAAAYTNSVVNETATSTVLYDIDTDRDRLLIQSPPNDGVLTINGRRGPLGVLGINVGPRNGFEIFTTDADAPVLFAAFQPVTAGNVPAGLPGLYLINIETGDATLLYNLPAGTLLDGLAIR